MKKILVLCMIFTMSFSMFACGSRNADADEGATNATEQQGQDGETGEETETPDVIIPDGFADVGEEDAEEGAAYDFGFTAAKTFAMSASVKKLNGSKIASEGSSLTSQFQKALDASALGSFTAEEADYDEYEGESIDKQLYTLAMPNDISGDESSVHLLHFRKLFQGVQKPDQQRAPKNRKSVRSQGQCFEGRESDADGL